MTRADEQALADINWFLDLIPASERARLLTCIRELQEKKETSEPQLARKSRSSRGPSIDDKRRPMTNAIGKANNK